MNVTADIFESPRSRLFGIAHRMPGIRSDAEDLVRSLLAELVGRP